MKTKKRTNRALLKIWRSIAIAALAIFAPTAVKAEDNAKQPSMSEDTVIHHTSIETVGGGFNPEYFGYRISGSVIRGTNECYASASKATLITRIEDNVLYVTPVVSRLTSAPLYCATHHDPEWDHLSLDVRYSRKEITKIVILNHNVLGGTQTIIP